MSAVRTWGWRALLAALTLAPLPAAAEIAARLDTTSGHVIVTGLEGAAIEAVLAEPDRLSLRVAPSASARGMLASLSQTGDALVVAPRFPLRPGTGYTLTLDMPDARFESALSMVAPEAPAPQVVGFSPSQGVIPANTLRLYLQFSEPMARGQLRNTVSLTGPDGQPVDSPFLSLEAELWDPGQTRATLLLDPGRIKQGVGPNMTGGAPLQQGQTYHLRIAPQMKSAAGVPLGKAIAITFRAGAPNRRAITPEHWEVLTPPAGSQTPMTIVFDRIMDSGAARRLISLHGPDGARLRGEITTDGGGWSLTPAQPWVAGRHRLIVDPDLEDVSGNTIAAPFDAQPGTIGTRADPAILIMNISPR